MSRRQLWTTYRDSFKEVNGNVVRARYTLEHCSPLSSSLETSRLLVDKLQALQDTMECGEESWRRFLEASRRLQEECCPPLKGQLEEESRHTERRWTGVNQDVLERLCSAGEERLLWQQFCAVYSSCRVEVRDAEDGCRQVLTETSAKDGTRDQLQVRLRITQDLANNVKMLQEGLQPVCEAADKLARRLDPSSSAAVQSDVQHLSGRMSFLVELLSLKAQEIQGLLEQHQDFQRHTESLEMVLSRSEEALRSAVPGPEAVEQARTEMVQTVKRLSAGLALSETEHCRVQELELRWERTRDTAWARCRYSGVTDSGGAGVGQDRSTEVRPPPVVAQSGGAERLTTAPTSEVTASCCAESPEAGLNGLTV
ncbi:nesprin-2-like [Pristis pectinata]|uniref:nesprin-2-like n=1 Tax=Pristis pectinata TaxID=685728 RepID=UPI00223E719B|nr:nesprin-2-like [Pristis pectinata]